MAEFNTYKTNRTNEIIAKYTDVVISSFGKYTQLIAKVFNIMEINKLPENVSNLIQSYGADYNDIRSRIISDLDAIQLPSEINVNEGTKKALLVGINYTGKNYQLEGCINDTNNIYEKLIESGFQPANIKTLTDITETLPYKDNIIQQLTELLQGANIGDFIVFTFSGHGTQIPDSNNDEADGKDEGFLALDDPRDLREDDIVDNLIIDGHLKAIINSYMKPGVTLLMLFDCCHSGTIGDLKYNYMKYSENDKNTETRGNVIIISGCRDDQSSIDATINGERQGAMTSAFLENLKPNITWRELIQNMCTTLATRDYNYKQVPKLSSGRFINIDTKFVLSPKTQ